MEHHTTAPYGSWLSPISAQMVAKRGMSSRGTLSGVQVEGERVFWRVLRGDQAGRYDLLAHRRGEPVESLLPREFSARSLVHEYGGGEYFLGKGDLFFVNHQDQRLYRMAGSQPPIALSPNPERSRHLRYADGRLHPGGDWIAIVEEDHGHPHEPANRLVTLSARELTKSTVLHEGHDFYAAPRFSGSGDRLCWLNWNRPRMPWQGTELWTSEVAGTRRIGNALRVAGGAHESVFQPEWGPDGLLYFVSDRSGWWNLYRWDGSTVQAILPLQAEFGSPAWVFGLCRYDFLERGLIACIYTTDGIDHLGIIDVEPGTLETLEVPFTAYFPSYLRSNGRSTIWFLASSPSTTQALYAMDISSREVRRVYPTEEADLPATGLSLPQTIQSEAGTSGKAHAFFYPPTNPSHAGPESEKPPLIVTMHGGPTGRAVAQLHWEKQFWTSRGFAVADVNYRGSTGFGRHYREQLDGKWGEIDVADCVSIARSLAERGLVDSQRLIIRGSSAGGFTAMAAVLFHDTFHAAGVYYAVTDLTQLAVYAQKFEAHYLDSLLGPLPAAEGIYRERSPIHNAHLLRTPAIFFHGGEDPIVDPSQTRSLVAILEQARVPHAFIEFPEEQHGFKRAESVVRALTAELYFYSKIFGFPLPETVEPIDIPFLPGTDPENGS